MQLTTAARNSLASDLNAQIGASAKLILYSGSEVALGTTIPSSQVLSTHTCDATAFAGSPSNGVLTANAIGGATAGNSGTATRFRITTSADVDVLQGTAGTSGTDLILNTDTVQSGGTVSISSLTIAVGNA